MIVEVSLAKTRGVEMSDYDLFFWSAIVSIFLVGVIFGLCIGILRGITYQKRKELEQLK